MRNSKTPSFMSRARLTDLPSLVAITTLALAAPTQHAHAGKELAPEFTHSSQAAWINSPPLTLAQLRGKPVLVEFWTFDCINCRRTLPWLKMMHQRYASDGLTIVSVHTPEFAHERDAQNVRTAVAKLGLPYPVMLDNDFSYWNAMANRYWPAFYLIDRQGRIGATAAGELHAGQARGDDFEQQVKRALADG
jgi:thiol-disulfide isomerase/thioredoxin